MNIVHLLDGDVSKNIQLIIDEQKNNKDKVICINFKHNDINYKDVIATIESADKVVSWMNTSN